MLAFSAGRGDLSRFTQLALSPEQLAGVAVGWKNGSKVGLAAYAKGWFRRCWNRGRTA